MQILAALALARAGDSTEAEKVADELQKQFPLDSVISGYWLPTIRASVEINRSDPSEAIGFLKAAAPYELGLVSNLEFGALLYPAYVRGQAYLLLHEGTEAAAEFQKFLDHRTLVANNPLFALAHLGLGRAYAISGDSAKARTAYQDFCTSGKTPTRHPRPHRRECRIRQAEVAVLFPANWGQSRDCARLLVGR